jgi:hypothetical protein
MKTWFWRLVLMSLGGVANAQDGACPPSGYDHDALAVLKAQEFAVDDTANRQILAEALVACLSDPDPMVRDGIAFEALSQWLRTDALHMPTRRRLLQSLNLAMSDVPIDPNGFRQPFAALVMSEVARTDRIEAWMTAGERADLVERAADYVESVRDYRGFIEGQGWRHGVAHGADLLMQLALNPALDKPQLDRLLAAVASQVGPVDHAYVDGESERLSRPVLFIAQRGMHSGEEWMAWFTRVAEPAPLGDWSQAYTSREGLNRRHNLLSFLRVAYVGARAGGDPKFEVLVPGLVAAMKAVP